MTTEQIVPQQTFTLEQVLELLNATGARNAELTGAAIAAGLAANAPKPKVTFGRYTELRNAGKPKLKRATRQNGFWLEEDRLTKDEIHLLNQISHTGRYINRIVEVIVHDEGAEATVDLRYHDASADQRMANAKHWSDLTSLLTQIVDAQALENAEQQELDKERADRKARAARSSFDSKATREAREKAGV